MKALNRSSLTVLLTLIVSITVLPVNSGGVPAQTEIDARSENCAKCHAVPDSDIKAAGGRHRNVPCIGCHVGHPPEVKKPMEQCSKCHLATRKVHFGLQGCLTCHKNPHTPLVVAQVGCDICHSEKFGQFRENKSKHSKVECSTCHQGRHKTIPTCQGCHGAPHWEALMGKFPKCGECHNIAHDLNKWPEPEAKAAPR